MRARRTGHRLERELAHELVALKLGHQPRHLILDADGYRKPDPGLPARCAATVLFDRLPQHDLEVIAAAGHRRAHLVGDNRATADRDDEYHDYQLPEYLARQVIYGLRA